MVLPGLGTAATTEKYLLFQLQMLHVDLKNLLHPSVPDLHWTNRTRDWRQCLCCSVLVRVRRASLKRISRLPSLAVRGLRTCVFVQARLGVCPSDRAPGVPSRASERWVCPANLLLFAPPLGNAPGCPPHLQPPGNGRALIFPPLAMANQVWRWQRGKGTSSWSYNCPSDPEIQVLIALSMIRRTYFECSCLGWITT